MHFLFWYSCLHVNIIICFWESVLLLKGRRGGSAWHGWVPAAGQGHTAEREQGVRNLTWRRDNSSELQCQSKTESAVWKHGHQEDTDWYIGVFVEDDLKEMRREDGWGFQMLLRSEDILLLSIWTWRGARQICKQKIANSILLTSTPPFVSVLFP